MASWRCRLRSVGKLGQLCGAGGVSPCTHLSPLPCVPTSDDDIVFEDFARQRLKGMKDDKEDEEERTNSPQLNDR